MINESVRLDDISHWAPPGSCQRLQMLRLDRIHPVVSGNKWFKLRLNLEAARTASCKSVLSFGGGWSNHLVALAYAAKSAGMGSLGMVRGAYPTLTPTLQQCLAFGMKLDFLSGDAYRNLKDGDDPGMREAFPEHWIIPEGGANELGLAGAAEIGRYIPPATHQVCLAVGTGTTAAGIERALPADVSLRGFCVAKYCGAASQLFGDAHVPQRVHLEHVDDARFGRWRPALLQFIQNFYLETGIQLDVVYTGKLMQTVGRQLAEGRFTGQRIVCIHTGGRQGNPATLFGPDDHLPDA